MREPRQQCYHAKVKKCTEFITWLNAWFGCYFVLAFPVDSGTDINGVRAQRSVNRIAFSMKHSMDYG